MNKLLWLFLTAIIMIGCLGEENFSTSAGDKVVCSVDTLNLDTVIPGQGSVTHTFLVRNLGARALRVNKIQLGQGSDSPFRVNVNGDYLKGGVNTIPQELHSGDSLRVFVEVTTTSDDTKDDLYESLDYLTFLTESGAATTVVLKAQSMNVIPTRALIINNDTLLDAMRPYQILDSLVIEEGCTLSLPAGARLYFHPDADLIVRGTLKATGTLENPVIFRGDRLGMMFENQPYDRISSQWQGIKFYSTSKDNTLNYCDIHSGKFGIWADNTDITIENSIIHNVQGNGIECRASDLWVANTQITNAGNDCVNITGGEYEFIHCTIAHFYPFTDSTEGGAALRFTNGVVETNNTTTKYPIDKLMFRNCIITGRNDDEIFGDDKSPKFGENPIPFSYGFQNCLLCTPKDDSLNQQFCKWENDAPKEFQRAKNFLPEFDYETLTFSFTLNPSSQAVDTASPEISQLYNTDRIGISRINTDNQPDMGCYEFKP